MSKDKKTKSSLEYWETASIDAKTLQLDVCYNGQQRFSYTKDNPQYEVMVISVKEKFPNLAPGQIGRYQRHEDGRTETTILDCEDNQA